MKKLKALLIIGLALALVDLLSGCQTATVKCQGEGRWEASVRSHWFTREIKGFSAEVSDGGKFKISLSGYKGDTSQQLPIFTRDVFNGVVALGQLVPMASKSVAPAASSSKNCAGGSCSESGDCTDCAEK